MALRRQVKNVVRNFSDIEVKVREATSNDPWGPSSSLTSEIADATYNNQAFTEIMTLLWKRINDHGKNWRHVYKSLVVLDYIVKTGSERVASQCRENIFAIKTLKDFQFIDKDGKDQGVNVREKSKQLVALLKDEERLKSERQRALKAKERFTQSQGGIGNTSFPKNKKFQGTMKYPEARGSVDDTNIPSKTWQDHDRSDTRSTDGRIDSEFEKVRPSNEAEEELQLQIALAMSREEAEKEHPTQNYSQPNQPISQLVNTEQFQPALQPPPQAQISSASSMDPWGQPKQTPYVQPSVDVWGEPPSINNQSTLNNYSTQPPVNQLADMSLQSTDPWGAPAPKQPVADPWGTPEVPSTINADPWAPSSKPSNYDPFTPQDPLQNIPYESHSSVSGMPPLLSNPLLDPMSSTSTLDSQQATKPSFLSNGAHLVDVDNILKEPEGKSSSGAISNPFSMSSSNTNPFLQDKPKPKTINELRNDKSSMFATPSGDVLLPTPLQPSNSATGQTGSHNPFL